MKGRDRASAGAMAKDPEPKDWGRDPRNPGLHPEQRGVEEATSRRPRVLLLSLSLSRSDYLGLTPPPESPSSAPSPSPLISILANTVSVNSSALMDESLQGLMVRMAWEHKKAEVRRPFLVGAERACQNARAVRSGYQGQGLRHLGHRGRMASNSRSVWAK